jgi:hypothetical protein
MDKAFIARNLSPGGSADLLAVTWLFPVFQPEGENERLTEFTMTISRLLALDDFLPLFWFRD